MDVAIRAEPSFAILPVALGAFGTIYLATALILGAMLLAGIIRVRSSVEWTGSAWRAYRFSLLYLALLFVAMAADRRIAG